MGIKYFCDRCGKEVITNGATIIINSYKDSEKPSFGFHYLCEECLKKYEMIKDQLKHEEDFFNMTDDDVALMEYDFKVGDKVITSRGQVGTIRSICYCDRCKERGFYEPKVEVTDGGDDTIWITDTDKRNGFISFYQIGKYKFGNIDKESVEQSIENEKENIKEAHKRLREYKKSLSRLNLLESWERGDKDFVVSVDYDGNLYGFDK